MARDVWTCRVIPKPPHFLSQPDRGDAQSCVDCGPAYAGFRSGFTFHASRRVTPRLVILSHRRMLGDVKGKLVLPIVLMVVFALSRIPGVLPQNFSAAYAIAFCGGLYFAGAMAWWLPMGTLIVTDILLNIFYYHASIFN